MRSGAQFGQVTYIQRGAIDRPLGLIRDRHNGTHLVVPHANFRGIYDSGTTHDGKRIGCTGAAGTSCVGIIWWPGSRLSAYLTPGPPMDPGDWFGSLIGEMTDASGLMYRRNRYYDPQSGQFTQEDPIGLAGGLNLYGYAEGDPVPYPDPSPASIITANEGRHPRMPPLVRFRPITPRPSRPPKAES
jgi:RHS repeat-associated protein